MIKKKLQPEYEALPPYLQPEITFVEGTRTALSEDVEHRVAFVGAPISPRPPGGIVLICYKEGFYKLHHSARPQIGQDSGA